MTLQFKSLFVALLLSTTLLFVVATRLPGADDPCCNVLTSQVCLDGKDDDHCLLPDCPDGVFFYDIQDCGTAQSGKDNCSHPGPAMNDCWVGVDCYDTGQGFCNISNLPLNPVQLESAVLSGPDCTTH